MKPHWYDARETRAAKRIWMPFTARQGPRSFPDESSLGRTASTAYALAAAILIYEILAAPDMQLSCTQSPPQSSRKVFGFSFVQKQQRDKSQIKYACYVTSFGHLLVTPYNGFPILLREPLPTLATHDRVHPLVAFTGRKVPGP